MDIPSFSKGNTEKAVSLQIQSYLTIFLTCAFVVWYAQFLWKRRYLYIHSWKVEGPLSFPIIGCGYIFLNKHGVLETIMKIQESASSGLLRVWMGPRLIYSVHDPQHIEKILNHPKALEKDDIYKFTVDGIGINLLTAPVKKWKYHRRMLAPAFNQKILDTFVEIFAEQSLLFADQLKSVVGRTDFDLYCLASRCTLDIICQTAMGVKMNIQKEQSNHGGTLDRIMQILTYRIVNIWCHLDLLWHLSPLGKELEKKIKEFHDVIASVVSTKMAEHNKNMEFQKSSMDAEIEEEPAHKRLAFLDLILKKSVFTEKELIDEVNIFLVAGTETTATSICCLFTMLGMHPEVQQKVYEEVIDILGTDRNVEASDLSKMKYTERVIKENLRLFPIAAVFMRALKEDIDLGDVILPAGSSAAFTTLYIHRNPKYWTDPLKFDPNRFLPEEVTKRHPCTYIPFSYGPRNCIGWKYAIANLKTLIAIVIRQYKIFTLYKSVEEIDLKIHLLLKMKDGPKVWIENR